MVSRATRRCHSNRTKESQFPADPFHTDVNNNDTSTLSNYLDDGKYYGLPDVTTAKPTIITRPVRPVDWNKDSTGRDKDGAWILHSALLSDVVQQLQMKLGRLNLSLSSIVHIIKKLLKSGSWKIFFQVKTL